MISDLIKKFDTFELVRDQIAGILVGESASQMALAPGFVPPQDPELWRLLVFRERSLPWEDYLGEQPAVMAPIVNVWFDSEGFDQSQGNVVEQQQARGVFNVDCYGYGVARSVAGGGQLTADQAAALEAQRCFRLVRNILMAAEYTYLGLRGLVGRRWPGDVQTLQPDQGGRPVTRVSALRFPLRVDYLEGAAQIPGEVLEAVFLRVTESTVTGQLLLEAEFPAT